MITLPWIIFGAVVIIGGIVLALVMLRPRDDDEYTETEMVPEKALDKVDVDGIYNRTTKGYMPTVSHAEVMTKIPAKVAAKKVAAKKTAKEEVEFWTRRIEQ